MKIDDAIKAFESIFETIEQNPVQQALRTDIDIVQCYTGGVAKEGDRSPAWAISEEDAVRLWYEAALQLLRAAAHEDVQRVYGQSFRSQAMARSTQVHAGLAGQA